jgi:hypothetical protein
MQLRLARLCLDCEEIHDQQSCPVCSSESFAYITRWIPQPDGLTRPKPTSPPEAAETYRELINPSPPTSAARQWAKRGAVALGALGLASWAWRQKSSSESRTTSNRRKKE